jgi:hypothetical protein
MHTTKEIAKANPPKALQNNSHIYAFIWIRILDEKERINRESGCQKCISSV